MVTMRSREPAHDNERSDLQTTPTSSQETFGRLCVCPAWPRGQKAGGPMIFVSLIKAVPGKGKEPRSEAVTSPMGDTTRSGSGRPRICSPPIAA